MSEKKSRVSLEGVPRSLVVAELQGDALSPEQLRLLVENKRFWRVELVALLRETDIELAKLTLRHKNGKLNGEEYQRKRKDATERRRKIDERIGRLRHLIHEEAQHTERKALYWALKDILVLMSEAKELVPFEDGPGLSWHVTSELAIQKAVKVLQREMKND